MSPRGMAQDPLTEKVIECAIDVHRILGPGYSSQPASRVQRELKDGITRSKYRAIVCYLFRRLTFGASNHRRDCATRLLNAPVCRNNQYCGRYRCCDCGGGHPAYSLLSGNVLDHWWRKAADKPAIKEFLATKVAFESDNDSFESALVGLANKVKMECPDFRIKILGDDLKFEGITKNQKIRGSGVSMCPFSFAANGLLASS